MTFPGLETSWYFQVFHNRGIPVVLCVMIYSMRVKQACVICKHHNLWDTSTEGLLSFKQMVLQHIRYTYNVPSGLAMIESVKVSNTHTLINQFGLFKLVYNIKTLSSLMQARNMFLHCWIMTPIKTNDKIAVWELQVWNPTFQWLHSQSGFGIYNCI